MPKDFLNGSDLRGHSSDIRTLDERQLGGRGRAGTLRPAITRPRPRLARGRAPEAPQIAWRCPLRCGTVLANAADYAVHARECAEAQDLIGYQLRRRANVRASV